tara:strand:- start:85 stop:708 length:624 start_codon:yes stop_codon:yes gene_type:complete
MPNEKIKKLFEELVKQDKVKPYLESLKKHHKDSYEHTLRVTLLAIELADKNKCNGFELRSIGYAGLLHDIGKTKVASEILSKTASLDLPERAKIDQHPRLGFMELKDSEYEMVRKIVIAHHEYKKNPYPRAGKDQRENNRFGEERRGNNQRIKILTQILAVADIYDALASPRSYKKALSKQEIKTIIEEQFTGDEKYIKQVLENVAN